MERTSIYLSIVASLTTIISVIFASINRPDLAVISSLITIIILIIIISRVLLGKFPSKKVIIMASTTTVSVVITIAFVPLIIKAKEEINPKKEDKTEVIVDTIYITDFSTPNPNNTFDYLPSNSSVFSPIIPIPSKILPSTSKNTITKSTSKPSTESTSKLPTKSTSKPPTKSTSKPTEKPSIKIITAEYIGQIDTTSFETIVDNDYMVFVVEYNTDLDNFKERDNIIIEYYTNEYNQNIVVFLGKIINNEVKYVKSIDTTSFIAIIDSEDITFKVDCDISSNDINLNNFIKDDIIQIKYYKDKYSQYIVIYMYKDTLD